MEKAPIKKFAVEARRKLIADVTFQLERYGITDEMTKNFLVYNFQKEKTQNGKKC